MEFKVRMYFLSFRAHSIPLILMTWQELALQLDLIAGETTKRTSSFCPVRIAPSVWLEILPAR